MCFHNRAIDQVQTVARFCRQRVENTLPDSSPRPAVEPIVRARVWAVAFGQIAPWDPRPQHVKYCIHDPPVVRARALPTLRHERLESRPFLIAEIESHDPPPPAVNHDPGCFSVNYAGTDPSSRCCVAVTSGTASIPPFGSRAKVSMAGSISTALRTSMRTGLTANAGAAASKERQNASAKVAVCVLKSSATRSRLGASSLSRASHLPTMSFSKAVKPVTLPLGLARVGTT